jgi:hypothetical protein
VFAVGETVILLPVPTNVPPQLPLYHFHVAAVPNEPPFTVSVTEAPVVMVKPGFAAIDVAATLGVLMVRVSVTVLSHPAAFVVTNV